MFTATETCSCFKKSLEMASEYIFWGYLDTLSSSRSDATSDPVKHEVTINDEQNVAFITVAYQRKILSYVFTVIPEKAFNCVEDVIQILILSIPTLIFTSLVSSIFIDCM